MECNSFVKLLSFFCHSGKIFRFSSKKATFYIPNKNKKISSAQRKVHNAGKTGYEQYAVQASVRGSPVQ